MSVTSATDPVEAVIDLLNNAAAGEWPSSTVPDRIERMEDSTPSERLRDTRLNDVSLYVHSPDNAQLLKYDPAGDNVDQTETVQVMCFTEDDSTANNYVASAQTILAGYATDNQQQTAWVDIWPESVADSTAEAFGTNNFSVIALFVSLRRNAPV